MTAYVMEEMTWPEVRDALGEVRFAILPVGSCEQHGPHLALSTDIAGSEVVARRLAEEVHPLGILAPPLRFGVSIHHMPFAGTITLQPETFQTVLMEVADSLRQHGIRRLLVVNGHGGNQNSLGAVSARMRNELGVRMAYTLWPIVGAAAAAGAAAQGKRLGHACMVETSMMMHLRPDLVRQDALAEGELQPPLYGDAPTLGIDGFVYWNEVSANGALEGAPEATPELGEKITRASLDGLAAFARKFAELDV